MSYRACIVFFLVVTGLRGQTPPPLPVITAVVNFNTFKPGPGSLSPGGLATIFGNNLGPGPIANPPGGSVEGFTVTAGGRPCAIQFSSAQQVNIQLPFELPVGPTNLIVDNRGSRSVPFAIRLDAASPGIPVISGFGMDGSPGAFLRANGTVVMANNAPNPGETITMIEVVGLGPTDPPVATGQRTPSPAPRTVNPPTVRVGDRVISALVFSGLIPGFFARFAVTFTLPGDLAPGTHEVTIETLGFRSNRVALPVTVTGLVLTQSGFTFQALQGGAQPAAQTFRIINGTTGPLSFTAATTTFNGGNWLSVSSASGTIPTANATTNLDVRVDPTGLSPGDYYGQVRVEAPTAPNSPRFVSVVLNVSAANVNLGPTVDPSGLIFVGVLGGQAPAAQTLRITNPSNRATTFTATAAFEGAPFFTFSPASATVNPGQPVTVSVQPSLGQLQAGVFRGNLVFSFPQENTSRVVQVVLIITRALNPGATASAESASSARTADDPCKPARLVPVFTTLGTSFRSVVAWPSAIETTVRDDCGTPLRSGAVEVTFSNSDPPLSLIPHGDGRWSATWTPRNPRNDSLQVTATARQTEQNIEGTAQIGGSAQSNDLVPLVAANGVVSAGSFSPTAAPSPGELVSIFGLRMADGSEGASSLPLPSRLQNAQVIIGGRTVPLVFASDGQINAVLPYDLPAGTTQQLVIRRGVRASVPEPIAIQSAQPSIFTTDLSGKGQGHIYAFPSPVEQLLADSARPARPGEFLVIYATGLGPVTPAATSGEATPGDTLRRAVATVAVSIGGVNAPVEFAGLTPGFTGLYQINTRVPRGVAATDAVPVVVSVGGLMGPTVTMAVGN